MKKIILAAMVLVLMAGYACAEPLSLKDTLDKFPLKQGVAYSILDSQLNYLSTIEVLNKGGVSFEVGYAGAADNTDHKLVGVISYPIIKMEKYLDVPIVKLIEVNVGVYYGVGNICVKDAFQNDDSNEKDYGFSATLINVKF